MRILLDESLPRRLKEEFKGHQAQTVPEAGWQGKKNGELMRLMAGKCDVFITSDQNLQYQLNLRNTATPIVILRSRSNRYDDLARLVPKIMTYLQSGQLEKVRVIS